MSTKIWQKPHTVPNENSRMVETFTIGKDKSVDLKLAIYDVRGTHAHAQMLSEIGILLPQELLQIQEALKQIETAITEGQFEIEPGIEDIHSQIELLLVQHAGEAGKKIHTARSRNDQVLLDIKWFLKDQLDETAHLTEVLFNRFMALSESNKNHLMPGYTHFQIAMVSSFGLWFTAYAESLTDDMELLLAARKICDKNPLGTAAGYGSSFPINRSLTTELMQFSAMDHNPVYAQTSRGKTEKICAMAFAGIAATLSKFAYDTCLYMNQNFGFISFPESLTTGSSIMPHKRNPDVFELIRAKCNIIQALPNELTLLTNNLPSGYHRDWQLTKERLFPTIESLHDCLYMMEFMLQHIQIKTNILNDDSYDLLFSVEAVNRLVNEGIPFREAYKQIGALIHGGEFKPEKNVNHSHEGSIGNLCNDAISLRFQSLREHFGKC